MFSMKQENDRTEQNEREEICKPESHKPKGDSIRALALLAQMGFSMAASIILSVWIGHRLDIFFLTAPRYTIVGVLLGLTAAFKSLFDLATKGD
jgi:F0F1-type ATP synthase assembly protein I